MRWETLNNNCIFAYVPEAEPQMEKRRKAIDVDA